ncbi:hypothetical protein ELH21_09275 [Rhizobium leguminosarum]|uniref:hypothetical protein n=1 Tax=Rhizobium leguminosarum TaxID=384 RepID=UPI00102F9BE8|nr:hypothetical protein [Rhizobium leguminosarum]TBD04569.1 hypothetical protein ELH21_09275 [Rhizobium leguminosarum]
MANTGPSITDIKLLFARSGNRCAFPKCTAPMALGDTLTGEVCHIKGVRLGSARHDPDQTPSERHHYANLVLMCSTHHTVIDDDEKSYTNERLLEIKREHEATATQISDSEASKVAVSFVQNVANIGQSGGLSAHTVNTSSITVHSAPSGNHLVCQRQIAAIENLWRIIQNFSREFSALILIDSILVPSEIDEYFRGRDNINLMEILDEYRKQMQAIHKMSQAGSDDAGNEKPFVTQRLWSIFFVIQGIYGRTALLLTNSFKERKFVDWRNDHGCDQLLRAVLAAQSVEQVKNLQMNGLRTAIDLLEGHFLAEAGMNRPQSQ